MPSITKNSNGEDTTVYKFLGGASLVEAFYLAYAAEPDNPQVRATLKGGMVDVAILDDRTPPDVLEHFVLVGNSMHGIGPGSSGCL